MDARRSGFYNYVARDHVSEIYMLERALEEGTPITWPTPPPPYGASRSLTASHECVLPTPPPPTRLNSPDNGSAAGGFPGTSILSTLEEARKHPPANKSTQVPEPTARPNPPLKGPQRRKCIPGGTKGSIIRFLIFMGIILFMMFLYALIAIMTMDWEKEDKKS